MFSQEEQRRIKTVLEYLMNGGSIKIKNYPYELKFHDGTYNLSFELPVFKGDKKVGNKVIYPEMQLSWFLDSIVNEIEEPTSIQMAASVVLTKFNRKER